MTYLTFDFWDVYTFKEAAVIRIIRGLERKPTEDPHVLRDAWATLVHKIWYAVIPSPQEHSWISLSVSHPCTPF